MDNPALDVLHNVLLEGVIFKSEDVKQETIKLLHSLDSDFNEAEFDISDDTNEVINDLGTALYGDAWEDEDEDEDDDDDDEEWEEDEEEEEVNTGQLSEDGAIQEQTPTEKPFVFDEDPNVVQ